jgi:hypothetical protein
LNQKSPRFWEIFFEVYEALPRQGPDNRASAAKALGLCRELPPSPAVLDLGCGVGGHLAFTDAVWRKEDPLAEVKASFELDYPAMGWVHDILSAIAACGFSLLGLFTLPDEAWWDDFYAPMQRRIEELRGKYAANRQALDVLRQLAREPEMHRLYSDYYAYEFFVARRR